MIISLSSFLLFVAMIKDYMFFSSYFFLDESLSFLILIFPLVFFLVAHCSFSSLTVEQSSFSPMIFFLILSCLSVSFSSNILFLFLLFLESCVIFMIIFIFRMAKDKDKVSSALFMFLMNMFPSILFGYFCWSSFEPILIYSFSSMSSLSWLSYLFFLGLMISKLPLFLFHFWLTKAHVSASGPGSMVLASLLLKISCVGVYKISFKFIFFLVSFSTFFLFFFSIMGLIFLLSHMVRFCDLKFMVACSSIVHMAPTLPFLLKSDFLSVYSSFLMVVGHGLISYFIFYLVSCFYESSQSKSSFSFKSMESFSSLFSLWMILFFLLNMGFPPFMSFLSEIIFSYLFFHFSSASGLFFLVSLMLSGVVFFVVSSKFLFGKKTLFLLGDFFLSLSVYSYIYILYFVFCFFSLKCFFSFI